eukprot:PhF_6_TR17622/c0_g1_i1/m.26769/K20368/CNIH, ERV14; protein cornichon
MALNDSQYKVVLISGVSSLISITLLCSYFFGFITTWIMAFILQVVLGFIACYSWLLFMDYHDNLGYSAIDLAKQLNPLFKAEVLLRVYQILFLIALGSYYMLLLLVPYAGYHAYSTYFGKNKIDASRLWKDIDRFNFDAKVKVGVSALGFFLHLFFMLYSIVTSIAPNAKQRASM